MNRICRKFSTITLAWLIWTCLPTCSKETPKQPSADFPSLPTQDSETQATYQETISSLNQLRLELQQAYLASESETEQEQILSKAGNALGFGIAGELAPFWYGTPWAYSGTSEVPGKGTIACGYFVTTLLRDAGLNLDRVFLAQQASEVMIRRLVTDESIKRYSDVPIGNFVASIEDWGPGLYVVGLDNHTGFIYCSSTGEVTFLHSAFVEPKAVRAEAAAASSILSSSRYRVLGKLTSESRLVSGWLLGTRFE